MDSKQLSDVKIGAEGAEKPRERCPDCGGAPRLLGPEDFPEKSREGVLQAQREGADLYECQSAPCGKRWAVLRRRAVRGASGVELIPPAPRKHGGKGTPPRRVRRAYDAHYARLIKKNEKLAARDPARGGSAPEAVDLAPVPTAEERRKARNAKKARKGKR